MGKEGTKLAWVLSWPVLSDLWAYYLSMIVSMHSRLPNLQYIAILVTMHPRFVDVYLNFFYLLILSLA